MLRNAPTAAGGPSCWVRQVLLGNFAVLQTVDPGYFGQGIYLTMDPEYAIEEYGRRVFGLTRVPLLICVVVVGNTLPVMPLRTPPGAMAAGISDMFFFCAFRVFWRRSSKARTPPMAFMARPSSARPTRM